MADGGIGDDVLIGTGGTDGAGNFNDGSNGISVIALTADEKIFAIDRQNEVIGPVVAVRAAGQVPDLNAWGAGGLILTLLVTLGRRLSLRRARS